MYAATEKHHELLALAGAPLSVMDMASSGLLSVRKSPVWGDKREEFVARYRDIAHCIRAMDGSWYSGVKPWSLLIRMGRMGVASHGGLLFPEYGSHVRNVDTCEGVGCIARPFGELVHENYGQGFWKGQWYWGPMADHFRERLDIAKAEEEALKRIPSKYGNWAIIGAAMTQFPFIREFNFLKHYKDLENEAEWLDKAPYCSMFQSLICQLAGADPCPGCALQYTTPQDTWQSLAWPIKIALVI